MNKKFFVIVDASDIGIGGMLAQEDDNGNMVPVAYGSHTRDELISRIFKK